MAFSYSYPHPAVCVDIVVFTVIDDRLKLLLVRRKRPPYGGQWALPGGFVGLEEGLMQAARRELREETGVNAVHLEQLYTFGRPERDPRERVISVAYLSIIPSENLDIAAASDAEQVGWFAVGETPPLAFDHDEILARALARLNANTADAKIALQFMPETFTLPELQRACEVLAGRPVDKRNFRKHILASQLIEPTGEQKRESGYRPAQTYRLAERNQAETAE